MALDPDCSMPAVVFAFTYTVINGLLFFSTIYALFKFCKDHKVHPKKRPPKLLYYTGLIFFIFSSLTLLATVRNAMSICFHGDVNYTDFLHWIYFIVFYGAETYLLWLVLFLRLDYVFKGSHYALSKTTTRIHFGIFIFIPLSAPFYFVTLWMVKGIAYTIILLISFVFIIGFSFSLSALFIYKLFRVFNNLEIVNSKKLMNDKLLSTISKSTMLAIISLVMTLLTPITLLFGYYAIEHSNNDIAIEAGACLLAFCSLFDVYTNFICVAMSYSTFEKTYSKICGQCDRKCRAFCILKIIDKKISKYGHTEIMSTTSKTSITHFTSAATQETHFTSVSPPNGGDGSLKHQHRHEYEQVDTEYDETIDRTDTRDMNTMPTPFTQENGANFEYDIPEEDEYEYEDEDEYDYDEDEQFKREREGQNMYTTVTYDNNNQTNETNRGVLHTL